MWEQWGSRRANDRDEEVSSIENCVDCRRVDCRRVRNRLSGEQRSIRAGSRQGLLKVSTRRSESLSTSVLVMSPAASWLCTTNVAWKRSAYAMYWLSRV